MPNSRKGGTGVMGSRLHQHVGDTLAIDCGRCCARLREAQKQDRLNITLNRLQVNNHLIRQEKRK